MPCGTGFWRCGIHLLPLLIAIFMPVAFLTTYLIAVLYGHVEAGFPYISDTGTYSPESCVFGQFMNIGAFFIISTVHIRYKQICRYFTDATVISPVVLRINKVAAACGYIAGFGISIVGNFQETNVLVVHIIGAVMAFGVGMVYAYLQTVLSYKMHPHVSNKATCHLRLILSLLITIFFLMTFAFGFAAENAMRSKWNPGEAGFPEHVVSTASEWLMSICMMIFFVTFVGEFKKIHVKGPTVHILTQDFVSFDHSTNDTASMPRIT